MIASALVHVSWNIAAKRVSGHFGVMWIGQALSAIVLLPAAVYCTLYEMARPPPMAYALIACCGLLQAIYFTLLSKAYEAGGISVVYPIARGGGVALTALAAWLVLDEQVSPTGAAGIAAIGIGSVLVGLKRSRDPVEGHRRALKLAGLIACTLAAGGVNDKVAVSHVHPITYIFCMFGGAALATLPIVLTKHRTALADAWRRHRKTSAVVGLGSMSAYLIVLFALRFGPLSYLVAFRELSVVLGALAGVLIFKEPLTKRKALGVTVIASGLVLVKLA